MTEEQIAELKAKAARADELEGKVKEFEEDESLKNFRQVRTINKNLKGALEKGGYVVGDDGTITEPVKSVSAEDVERMSEAAAERIVINKTLARAKKDMTPEDQATFDRYYKKAITDETVNAENVEEYVEMAFNMASNAIKGPAPFVSGGAPRTKERDQSFATSERGEAVYKAIFNK